MFCTFFSKFRFFFLAFAILNFSACETITQGDLIEDTVLDLDPQSEEISELEGTFIYDQDAQKTLLKNVLSADLNERYNDPKITDTNLGISDEALFSFKIKKDGTLVRSRVTVRKEVIQGSTEFVHHTEIDALENWKVVKIADSSKFAVIYLAHDETHIPDEILIGDTIGSIEVIKNFENEKEILFERLHKGKKFPLRALSL